MLSILKKARQFFLISWFRQLIPDKLVNDLFHLPLAILAVLYYRYPAKNLTVIGVTGTDGKTTTATLIYEILKKAGFKTALISTVAVKMDKQSLTTGLHVTSPSPWKLQRLLRQLVDKGFQHLVLESTSHGLAQYRLLGCNFNIGVITNITHEHLDYHKTYANYLLAKAKLFQRVKFSVLNKDDQSFKRLKQLVKGKIITYGFTKADYTPKKFPFQSKLLGDYNRYNCLAAISVAKILQIKEEEIRKAIKNFLGIPGRMEQVATRKKFKVFIDFAHTPNALEKALQALKELKPRNLIVVFGAAGLRDKEKRPMMGKIACQLAGKVVLTAEDPRTEDVNQIIEEIEQGCENKAKIYKYPDRKEAIKFALTNLARKDDIIVICGKGHEQSMCFGNKEYPWSDRKTVKNILKLKRRKNDD